MSNAGLNTSALPWGPDASVVELGGGSAPIFRPNVDVRKVDGVDIVQDLLTPLPFTEELDGVFSKFALEHVSWRDVPKVMGNIHRALKVGGWVVLIVPNTEAQMKWALNQEEIGPKVAQCLFGDQDYKENGHLAAFSPAYAFRLLEEAGFWKISTRPFGELKTDMVIEGCKAASFEIPKPPRLSHGDLNTLFSITSGFIDAQGGLAPSRPTPVVVTEHQEAALWTPDQRKKAYNRHYFDGGRGKVGGYSREGYRDFPVHNVTFKKLMGHKPKSVLELGCARGFLVKKFQDAGIPAEGLDVSNHCFLTRACKGVQEWDLTDTPWPFEDKAFDFCYSMAVLEHIPEQYMDAIANEIRRVSVRGLHGVDFGEHDDKFDKTHCLFRDQQWWFVKLNGTAPTLDKTQDVVDKESLEKGDLSLPQGDGSLKLNLGCATVMYHHGWENIDINPLHDYARSNGYKFSQHDLAQPFPIRDGAASLVHLSHVLEHFHRPDGLKLLKEIHRVMAPGAILRVAVPCAGIVIKAANEDGLEEFDEINDECAETEDQEGKLFALLLRGHHTAYCRNSLEKILKAAGFRDVIHRGFRESSSGIMLKETVDQYPDLSLFMEAEK